ncbi:hypothetical protein Btru_001829 [Bulinus truncatus]|nr:hypothetical protein Btru_001829 [Bulinus truncatus]
MSASQDMLFESSLLITLALYSLTDTLKPCELLANGSLSFNCTGSCPCINSSECVRPFLCAGGCREGYTRNSQSGSCITAKIKGEPPSLPGGRSSRRSVPGDPKITLHRFVPEGVCYRETSRNSFVKRWKININFTLVVQQVTVLFDLKPSEPEEFFITFNTKLYLNVTFEFPMTVARNGSSIFARSHLESLTFADSLRIDGVDSASQNVCSSTSLAAVLVYGQAVCPYGTWGVRCNSRCRCPCDVAECHPTSGYCWARGFACVPGKFGPSCSRNCSEICGGSPRECHLTTGVCKKCENASFAGAHCEQRISPGEVEARLAICQDIKLEDPTGNPGNVLSTLQPQPSRMYRYLKSGSSVTLIIATIIVVGAFIVACVAYVMLIRHCASQKLRKCKMAQDERDRKISMMSYSELRKEYAERFLASQPSMEQSLVMETVDQRSSTNDIKFDAMKRQSRFSWTPLVTIIKDIPDNKGFQPGLPA